MEVYDNVDILSHRIAFAGLFYLLFDINGICGVFNHNENQPVSNLFADDVKYYLDITSTASCDILQDGLIAIETKSCQLSTLVLACNTFSLNCLRQSSYLQLI